MNRYGQGIQWIAFKKNWHCKGSTVIYFYTMDMVESGLLFKLAWAKIGYIISMIFGERIKRERENKERERERVRDVKGQFNILGSWGGDRGKY